MINKQQKLEEFDNKFPLGCEIWVLERHKKEVRDYLSNLIDEVSGATTQSLLEELEKSKIRHATNTKGEITKYDAKWQIEMQEGIDIHNQAIDKAISIVKKHMGEK